MAGFEARQVMVVHESVWNALVALGEQHGLRLDRVPDGADDDGTPFFREDRPDTECPQCGHVPTYAFMPRGL